jgi:hypothetical protein
MSCLKLYWPVALALYPPSISVWQPPAGDRGDGQAEDADDGPVILKFPGVQEGIAGRIGPRPRLDPLERARILHANRCCPECGRAAVVPVDAEPAVAYRNAMAVPGDSQLIGFHCDGCGHEWER